MIEVGTRIPEVDVYDGKGAAPIAVFFAGPALLLFFRGGCRRCEGLLGLVAGMGKKARGLTVIGVSQETIEDTGELLNTIRVRMPVVIDDRPYRASQAFGLESLPAAVLIENDHVAWGSDGCDRTDLAELAGRVSAWTRDADLAVHPDYEMEPASASKHHDH
ncbi:MAG: TlpA family protein disulfide reductase [Acidimicrobiia bacterium]